MTKEPPAMPTVFGAPFTNAMSDVLRERIRQVNAEGWDIRYGGGIRRPFDIEGAETMAKMAVHFGVPVFFKQDTAFRSGERGRASDWLWGLKQFPEARS